jgi:hypothetical protein
MLCVKNDLSTVPSDLDVMTTAPPESVAVLFENWQLMTLTELAVMANAPPESVAELF